MEVETQLFIACRLGYLTKEGLSSLRGKSSEIGRLVNGLMNSL
jgi:four helix bundle protein